MKWTTNRPTEPGDYWLAIHPDQRGALYDEGVYKVVLRHGEGKVWQAGCLATIPEERLAGAQWSPRETPADPFAQSAGTWSPRIAVLEKIAGALGYRIEIMPGLDVAGRCHYHRRLIEIGEPDARYAFSVIAHELGHALHGCLVEDVETARTKEQREACATAFASVIGMMAGCEHGRGTDCNLAHAPTAESMGAVLAKIADVKKADGLPERADTPWWCESCRRNNASTAQEGMWCGRWRKQAESSVQTQPASNEEANDS